MRTVLREHSLRVLLSVLGMVTGSVLLLTWTMRELQAGGVLGEPDARIPTWVLLSFGVLGLGLGAAVAVPLVRSHADRTAERLAAPLRLLAHRADELASGGFALDPQARPGRLVEPEPWEPSVPEIDAIVREVDRHHATFARALVFERSFAADASHQLRTPLAALLLRLEEITHSGDAAARAEAEVAIGQVERLTGVVEDLLQRSRVGHASGGGVSAVDSVLGGLDEEWTPAFDEAGRRIVLAYERNLIVEASDSQISQVLNTLVENALRHGVGTVELRATRSGPSVVFTVMDEGPGISPAAAHAVFERGHTTGAGTGLGLGVARDTAEAVGGRLELMRLRPPTFACYLPLAVRP